MTHQQELELLAEWLGIEIAYVSEWNGGISIMVAPDPTTGPREWNPLTNDTDFLNMVVGRVDITHDQGFVRAYSVDDACMHWFAKYADHNNDKLAAMKHAAYQVCLMAAREWKDHTQPQQSKEN